MITITRTKKLDDMSKKIKSLEEANNWLVKVELSQNREIENERKLRWEKEEEIRELKKIIGAQAVLLDAFSQKLLRHTKRGKNGKKGKKTC